MSSEWNRFGVKQEEAELHQREPRWVAGEASTDQGLAGKRAFGGYVYSHSRL